MYFWRYFNATLLVANKIEEIGNKLSQDIYSQVKPDDTVIKLESHFLYDYHNNEDYAENTRPVVIWHGLGDSYNSSHIGNMESMLKNMYPGMYIYNVRLDDDPSVDKRMSFLGNATEQVEIVCEKLTEIPELQKGFDAIGFSQGGLFLRSLVQTCATLKIGKLITFGSPHMGIKDLPICEEGDWFCKRKNAILKGQIWNERVQSTVVPAQYFRDPAQYDRYLEHSHFLGFMNNEHDGEINISYGQRMSSLEKLVLVMFNEDKTLVPKESAFFYDSDAEGRILNFNDTKLYKQDLIGLKRLLDDGRIDFFEIDEDHMRIPQNFFLDIAEKYLGAKI